MQIAVTAAVAEATAPPPPPPPDRNRELEDKVVVLTAELKAANDKCAGQSSGRILLRVLAVTGQSSES